MKTLPPCDNDECPPTRCAQTESAQADSVQRMVGPTPQKAPEDIAHEWLKKDRESYLGHISTWTPEQMDKYHTELGLLINFVTECWPNGEVSHGPLAVGCTDLLHERK